MTHDQIPMSPANESAADPAPEARNAAPGGRLPFRTQLLLVLLIPFLGLAAGTAYLVQRLYAEAIRDAQNYTLQLAESTAAQTERFLRGSEHLLQGLSQRTDLQAMDPARCADVLPELLRLHREYANLLTLDARGELVCSARPQPPGAARGPDPSYYFAEAARTRQFTVGRPARGFLTGRWVSTLAQPILSEDGRFLGVVAAAVDLERYQPLVEPASQRLGTVALIVNREGVRIARSGGDPEPVGAPSDAALHALTLQHTRGTVQAVRPNGQPIYLSFVPIGQSGWYARVGLASEPVRAEARRVALTAMGIGVAALLLLMLVALRLSRRLSGAVQRITDTMDAQVRGDRGLRVPPLDAAPELQRIGAQFNAMLDASQRAEVGLRESAARLGLAIEAARIATLDWAVERDAVRLSNVFAQMPGLDAPVPSAVLLERVHPDDRDATRRAVDDCLAGDGQLSCVFRVVVDAGRPPRWLLCRGRVEAGADGRRLLAVLVDITEQETARHEIRELHEALQRHARELEQRVEARTAELAAATLAAEAASRAKSAFLANMSHEIRTPINGMLGMAYLLRQSGVTAEQAARIEKIEVAGRHLVRVINDVLDLSKIEASKLTLAREPFSVQSLFDELQTLFVDPAAAKGLALSVDRGDLPDTLVGDRTRLSQALVNYLGNAIKFTERGSVTLRAFVVETGASDLRVRFEVTDTGIGIGEAEQAGLFQAFRQVDESSTRAFGGTGLGLAITRRLALLMDGDVGVRSAPGQGSTFWLTARLGRSTVPVAADPPQGTSSRDRLRALHGGARILVVEDNRLNQTVLCELLRMGGLEPTLAADGQQAVDQVARMPFDLVLMDMQMPVLDGLAATRAIRQRMPASPLLPIVAMTANVFESDRQACLDAGMNDFLAKPVEPEALFGVLLRWLGRPAEPPQSAP